MPARNRTRLLPAERCTSVNIVDPQGHRLIRVGRDYSEPDPAKVWWEASSLGPTTEFSVVEAVGDGPEMWLFACKTCRDQGKGPHSTISLEDVRATVGRLWRDSDHLSLARGQITTTPL